MCETRNSSLLGKITILFVICCFSLPAHAKYGGGTGEPNDPYLIYDANQMNEIGLSVNWDDWDKHFKLMADIDLSGFTGTSFNIIGNYENPFTGVFYGNGHTISNFTYTSTETDHIGIFGYVDYAGAEIKNLGLIDPNVNAGTGNFIGSLVGYLEKAKITECYVQGGSLSGARYVGGLVGNNSFLGTITNSYSAVSVSGSVLVGGLVGCNEDGTIENCYSLGSVTGITDIGGLLGFNIEGIGGAVTDSFWDIETSGQATSAGGTGKTTAEMKMAITFAGWGCYPIWTIDEGNDYPRLWWENMPGEPITTPSYGGGSGEPNDTFLIYTPEELNTIGLVTCHLAKHFKLMADIDLSAFTGTSFNIIGISWSNAFSGTFDGNGHTISNFNYNSTGSSNIGLFGYLRGSNAEIKNLGLIDAEVDAKSGGEVGSLVGRNSGGFLSNCYSTANVSGEICVGGLVGLNLGSVWNCYFIGKVRGKDCVGGLVGYNNRANISNCYSNSDVCGTEWTAGGLVGLNYKSSVSNCYSTGNVNGHSSAGGLVGGNSWCNVSNCYSTGDVNGVSFVGGLVGYNEGSVLNCYSTGDVDGGDFVGGLVGENMSTITNCYSTGIITGDFYVGGLVGGNSKGTITDCYSTGSVAGDYYVGGLVGKNYKGTVSASFWDIETSGTITSAAGTGLPTAEMQTMNTFTDAGWDFITPIWTIDESNDYPRFWWEFVPNLHAEPEVTLGTSNTITWDPVPGANDFYAECAEDANFTSIVYSTGWITETSYEFTGLQVGKRYWYSVKARNAVGTESNWSNVESSLQVTLAGAVDIMLDPNNLKSEKLKKPYINKINIAQDMIDRGIYNGALSKLENDILPKTNGCAESGEPDKSDWIITCEEQELIYPLVIETIEYIRILMEQSLD